MVYLAAMAWPWGAYADIYRGHGVFSVALAVLAILMGIAWVRQGRPGIPFDLFWPAVLLALFAFLHLGTEQISLSLSVLAGCAAFLLALSAATTRELVFRALAVSVLSAGCVGLLTVAADFNYVFPTHFAVRSAAVVGGPKSVSDALLMFSWAFVASIVLLVGCNRPVRRVLWLLPIAAMAAVTALYFVARHLHSTCLAWQPNYQTLAFPALPVLLLAFYLVSRVAARLFLDAKEYPGTPGRPWGLLLLFFSLALAFLGTMPSPGICFTVGLLAAMGVRPPQHAPRPPRIAWAWLVMVPIVAAHAFILFPGDARNYAEKARALSAQGGTAEAGEYLGRVLTRFPGEACARMELARIELGCGQVEAAADTFCATARERRNSLLGAPAAPDVDAFVENMKKAAGAATGIAYERCLAATEKVHEAILSLKARIKTGPVQDVEPEPLRRSLAALLGCTSSGTLFEDWTAAELLAGLGLCGEHCQFMQATPDVPRRYLPAVLTARPLEDGRLVTVFYPGGQIGRVWHMPRCTGETPGEGETWWLSPLLDSDFNEWCIPLAGSADVGFGDEMTIRLTEDRRFDCGPDAGEWSVLCLLP